MDTYEQDRYVTTIDNLRTTLDTYGVAILLSVLSQNECEQMLSGAWDYLENLSSKWPIPLSRNNQQTWKHFSDLFPSHSMLMQHWGIGQAQFLWDVRQNPNVVKVFSHLWGEEELLVSFDGASVHLPPEITRKGYAHKLWLHCDQSFTRNDFEDAQSWVTACDVEPGDATLVFLEGSHKFHKTIADKFNLHDRSDWHKLSDAEIKAYESLGCPLRRIKCPAGSMVLWDSRTIHCGQEAMKGRATPKMRCVGYICMAPKSRATEAALKKKQKAFTELRTTMHNPAKIKLFPKIPRTYGAPINIMTQVRQPVLTELGKKLAGF